MSAKSKKIIELINIGKEYDETVAVENFNFYVKNGLTKMEAIKKTAKDRGVGKNEIYKFFID